MKAIINLYGRLLAVHRRYSYPMRLINVQYLNKTLLYNIVCAREASSFAFACSLACKHAVLACYEPVPEFLYHRSVIAILYKTSTSY